MLGLAPDPNKVRRQLQEGVLHDINMGYYAPNEIKPHSSVKFHRKESKFVHPLSLTQSTRKYAYSKLHDVLPLELYLKLPYHMIDDLLEGLRLGSEERYRDDEQKNKEKGKTADQLEAERIEKETRHLMESKF